MTDETIHVLLIEDNPADIRLMRNLLSEASSVHFTWVHVEQLEIATEILRTERFDLVLLDLSLPDTKGLDTFNRLYPHAICLPIVVLTNPNDEQVALKAVQAGAQDYLLKEEMDGELIVRALRHAIQRKHTEISLRVKIRQLSVAAQQLQYAVKVGHELNNSLATVMLSVEALLAQIPPHDLKHTDLQMIYDEVNRMGRLVANLLQLSHHSPAQISMVEAVGEVKDLPNLIQNLHKHRIITVDDDETYFFQAFEAGTAGYILKGAAINELIALMHNVIQEGMLIPRELGPRLLNHYLDELKADGVPTYEQLSPREREIIGLIARGRTNKEIAQRLSISVRTVERHRSSIMKKLGLQNRAELVAYAVQQGLRTGSDVK